MPPKIENPEIIASLKRLNDTLNTIPMDALGQFYDTLRVTSNQDDLSEVREYLANLSDCSLRLVLLAALNCLAVAIDQRVQKL